MSNLSDSVGSALNQVCSNQSDVSSVASTCSFASPTPLTPAGKGSITFRALTQTRGKLENQRSADLRNLLPMKSTVVRRSAPTDESVKSILSCPSSDKLLLISSHETPLIAFKKLIDFGVQSAPVIEPGTHKICGFLDVRDLVSLVVAMVEEENETKASQLCNNSSSNLMSSQSLRDLNSTCSNASGVNLAPKPPLPGSHFKKNTNSLHNAASFNNQSMEVDIPISPPPASIPSTSSSPSLTSPNVAHNHSMTGLLTQVFNHKINLASFSTKQLDHKPQDYTVTYLAARNRVVTVDSEVTILHIVELLATLSDVHRIVVINKEKKIVDIVSQSDIVKLLHVLFQPHVSHVIMNSQPSDETPVNMEPKEHVHTAADHELLLELELSIEDTNIGSSPVITVHESQAMINTLSLMSTQKISGAAIVDSTGKFLGNTSGADQKLYLQNPNSSKLDQPVIEFIGEVRRSFNAHMTKTISPTVAVFPNTSLLVVITKLTATGMHRVFVVDEDTYQPLAVVSVEDIVKAIHRGCPSRRMDRQLHRAMSMSCLSTHNPDHLPRPHSRESIREQQDE